MKTIRRYQEDRYLSALQSKIVESFPCPDARGDLMLVLYETIFFPGGGGQSCDLGKINGYPVTDVFERDDDIVHVISLGAPSEEASGDRDGASSGARDDASGFDPGDECTLEIDWGRRFDNMQRHCGEHILSGVFYDLYGGVNRGFHMGDDYMTIDISLEDNPEFKEITWEMAMAVELRTNEIIWRDLPVTPHHFDTREEAASIKVRKALTIDEDITIVTIGDTSHPADSVACCGTHPSTTGQVGMLKIYKVEPNKGMFRIYFEAGKRALQGYDDRFNVLTTLEKDLSAGLPDIMEKYESRKTKSKEVRDRLYHLTKEVVFREAERIKEEIGTAVGESGSVPILTYTYKLLTIDDLIEIGRSLEGNIPCLLALISEPENVLLLFSDRADCGKLIKDNAQVFGGKGGGKPNFARAIFARKDDMEMFISAISNLIK